MNPYYFVSGFDLFRVVRIGVKVEPNTASLLYKISRLIAFACASCLFFVVRVEAQPLDYSNCPDCSSADISLYAEVTTKYQGIKGTNPAASSTYRLIGKHKYNGGGYGSLNSAFGNNWYPLRVEKQILSGVLHSFGVSNYGNESDWNIYLLPSDGFEDFISTAIPYKSDNWYGHDTWKTTSDGKYLIEAEITPNEYRYGNPWFSNADKTSPLINKRLCVYGPFVREESHGNHPEIHPSEQIWWKEGNDAHVVLLAADASFRFNGIDDYDTSRVRTPDYKAWTQSKNQQAELSIAFDINPSQGSLYMDVQALDDFSFYAGASYRDAAEGNKCTIFYKGDPILTVQESASLDQYVGVTFRDICFKRAKGTLQGYVVLNTAIGNGSDGKEGFVALRIARKQVGFNEKPTLLTGDLSNNWEAHDLYDNRVSFADIISSDQYGKGVVDGIMDFNGNGKTDFLAEKDDKLMVLFDGKGRWKDVGFIYPPPAPDGTRQGIQLGGLYFGDINGDRKTDILRVNSSSKVEVYDGNKVGTGIGTGRWQVVTDAGEQSPLIRVGDFNRDGKTDIVYFKYRPSAQFPPQPLTADMYVKYGCQGSWRRLSNGYILSSPEDYEQNFRFGDFNGDGITDIFRYYKDKFVVYWNGTGDYRELCDPGFNLKVDDLLFVDNLSAIGYTDIIYVDRASKKWTVFYKGKTKTSPRTIKYGDQSEVRFGNLDADAAWELIAFDFSSERISPHDVAMSEAQKAKIESTVMPKYAAGSLRRVQAGNQPALTVKLNLKYYPGTDSTDHWIKDFRSITAVREQAGSKALPFRLAPATLIQSNETQTIGTIDDVPLSGTTENRVQLMFAARSTPLSYKLPAYAISGVTSATVEKIGAVGAWQSWVKFLSATVKPDKAALLTLAPAMPSQVKTIEFELLPFYSSIDDGRVSLIEMDDVSQELNEIAYGVDQNRKNEIFGGEKIFAISWQFQFKNITTGRSLQISNANSLTSDGAWPKNKVAFNFPPQTDLLEFKAIATIKDLVGNSTLSPVEFVFWNQRISLTEPDEQITEWLTQLKDNATTEYERVLERAKFLGDDKVLTLAELSSLLK